MDNLQFQVLHNKFPARELQIRLLLNLFTNTKAFPSSLVVHGSPSTGKSSITEAVLNEAKVPFTVINCRECITSRHLFEHILRTVLSSPDTRPPLPANRVDNPRCDNANTLSALLGNADFNGKQFVLVLDNMDKMREMPATLLAALARLGQIVPALTTIMIVTAMSSRVMRLTGIPSVFFPPYSRREAIRILSNPAPAIFLQPPTDPDYTEDLALEDNAWVWTRYLDVLWDSLANDAARDLTSFRSLAEKLWRPFVAPILDGTLGTRDFSRLMVLKRGLFQDEDFVAENVIRQQGDSEADRRRNLIHDLSYHSKYLLCAAYLASYTAARQDAILFMKTTEKKRQRKGGAVGKGKVLRNRRIPRQLLSPSPFGLDRLLSIFRAITPSAVAPTAEIHTQLATLRSLRLLVRAGVSTDALDPGNKMRVNFSLDFVSTLGRSIGFELSDYLAPAG